MIMAQTDAALCHLYKRANVVDIKDTCEMENSPNVD